MTREKERNMIAREIAWQHTKHYDPLLSKESWCEMAAREAIDWADETMINKACEWLKSGGYFVNNLETEEDFRKAMKAMEE